MPEVKNCWGLTGRRLHTIFTVYSNKNNSSTCGDIKKQLLKLNILKYLG